MKKHILSKFSNSYNYQNNSINHYDEVTQISYKDSKLTKKIMNRYDTSSLTETIENSDPDEFKCQKSTIETATVENSDPDEFRYINSTKVTFTVENSDEDELYMIGVSVETRVVENSDPDEFIC